MVSVTMMEHCQAGQHHKCPGAVAAPRAEYYGGVICECRCHRKSRSFEELPPSSGEIEVEFWRAVKGSDDPDDFQLYLQQFPDGEHAEEARQTLAGLTKKT